MDDGFGKPPDLNDVWKASVEKFDRQRQAFAQLESSLAEAINVIRQVIARSINELNQIPEYVSFRTFMAFFLLCTLLFLMLGSRIFDHSRRLNDPQLSQIGYRR